MQGKLVQADAERNHYSARWRVLAASFTAYGFDAMDFMVLALSLSLITAEFHLSLGEAGLLGTASMLGVGASSVLVGWYSDNFGRQRALIYCITVFGVFTAAVFWARGWWDIMALRFLAGLGLGGAWGVITAYINETWPPATRGRAIAFVLSSWPVGYIATAIIARSILPTQGWRMLFLIGGFAVVAAVLVWWFVPESAKWRDDRDSRRAAEHIAIREIFSPALLRNTVLGLMASTCVLIGYWGANTWLPSYLTKVRGLDQSSVTGFLIVMNLGMFAGYQLFGAVSDKYGQRQSLIICCVGAALLLPIYAMIPSANHLYWLGPILGVFFSFGGACGAYLPALYPTRVRSLGAGFCFDVGRGVAALAPFAFGKLAEHIGLAHSIAWSAAGFLLAAIIVGFMPDRR
jgi:predicted MFS family arabinose efflux permease